MAGMSAKNISFFGRFPLEELKEMSSYTVRFIIIYRYAVYIYIAYTE